MAMNPAAGPDSGLGFAGSGNDCFTGTCSIYCPQWCYFVFPPPPPSEEISDSDSRTALSPLVIALIAALATVFLLLAYYTVISKYCRRRRRRRARLGEGGDDQNPDPAESDGDPANREGWQPGGGARGLDDAVIKSITVFEYKRGDGLVDGTDCSVCLSEFKEAENLRLLPKCTHAFHVDCIDAWLKSHSNCPLCRSNIAIPYSNPKPDPSPEAAQGPQNSPDPRAASLQIQRREEALVMVVEDSVRVRREEILVMSFPKAIVQSPPPPRETRFPRDAVEIAVQDEEGFGPSAKHRDLRPTVDALRDGDEHGSGEFRSSSTAATGGSSTQREEEGSGESNDRSSIQIAVQEERFDCSSPHQFLGPILRNEDDDHNLQAGNRRSTSMAAAAAGAGGSSTQIEEGRKSNERSSDGSNGKNSIIPS